MVPSSENSDVSVTRLDIENNNITYASQNVRRGLLSQCQECLFPIENKGTICSKILITTGAASAFLVDTLYPFLVAYFSDQSSIIAAGTSKIQTTFYTIVY